ncbi:MAG: glycolate oxidase subunit GlcE, partial [Gammaproteobacteria bacterium]
RGAVDEGALRRHVAAHGGHVVAYDTPDGAAPQVPEPAQVALMKRIRRAFDPHAVFHGGRLGAWLQEDA